MTEKEIAELLRRHGVPPRACTRPPWWRTLARIDAEKIKLLRDFQESLRLAKKGKK